MAGKLENKVAIVTGSGTGIGRAVALAMAREGAKIVTNNRKRGSQGGDAEVTATEIKKDGGQALPVFGDVGDFAFAKKLVQTTVDKFGTVDILANIAGFAGHGKVWDMSPEDFDSVVRACLYGSFNCTRNVLPFMLKQKWGRIINTASLAWLRAADLVSYAAAKGGVLGFTRGVAMDLEGTGVTCNAFAPIAKSRAVGTPELNARYKELYDKRLITKAYYEQAGNPPPAEHIAPLLIYLCTDAAAGINGQWFRIVGGHIGHCWYPMYRTMIYKPEGWTADELMVQVPEVLMQGYVDPSKV